MRGLLNFPRGTRTPPGTPNPLPWLLTRPGSMDGPREYTMFRFPPPLRHSKFRLFWAGQFANVTGNGIFPVAIALFLLTRHDAARALGVVLAADSLGKILPQFRALPPSLTHDHASAISLRDHESNTESCTMN
jgi:hypothetical protein